MTENKGNDKEDSSQDDVRWVTEPLSRDRLRIIPGHKQAAIALTPVIVEALKTHNKVVLAAGGESGTGKSEIAYIVNEMLIEQNISVAQWSFDNAYVTTPEEREEKRAEDYDNNVGLNEMNQGRIAEIISCFEKEEEICVPIVIINEDGTRPVKEVSMEMKDKKVLIFDGLYAALVGKMETSPTTMKVIAMSEKKFNLAAQKERGKEEVNDHRMKVLEKECAAVRSLWPHVTHRITESWEIIPYIQK